MSEFFQDIVTIQNAIVALITLLGYGLFLVKNKAHRRVLKELKEFIEYYREANADKKLTKAEKERLFNEALDFVQALIAVVRKGNND